MSDEQIDYIVNHEISLEDSHPSGEAKVFWRNNRTRWVNT